LDQKKVAALPALATTLLPADTWAPWRPILELDELWTFVLRKADDKWIWLALCRQSRQVVAFVVGDRSEATCRRLWEAIPQAYRAAICYSDFWAAYAAVIPSAQHRGVGKETGETAHVERYNNTLRQRLGRLVRKTLSFSKATAMLVMTLQLFIHRYNEECAAILRM
jgi:insertion element IS1 protein InsB